MIFANVRSEGNSVLNFFVAEWTVEGEAVDVVTLNVFPGMESMRSILWIESSQLSLTSRGASSCLAYHTSCSTRGRRHPPPACAGIGRSVS